MDRMFLLAHHPICDTFIDHSFKIGKYRVCKGCSLGYPTAIIIILAGILTSAFFGSPHTSFLIIAMVSFSLNLLKMTRFGKMEVFSHFLKVIRGVTLGFGFLSAWFAPSFWLRIGIGISLALLYSIFVYAGVRKFLGTCSQCEYHSRIPDCPGLNPGNYNNNENNNNNGLEDMTDPLTSEKNSDTMK